MCILHFSSFLQFSKIAFCEFFEYQVYTLLLLLLFFLGHLHSHYTTQTSKLFFFNVKIKLTSYYLVIQRLSIIRQVLTQIKLNLFSSLSIKSSRPQLIYATLTINHNYHGIIMLIKIQISIWTLVTKKGNPSHKILFQNPID